MPSSESGKLDWEQKQQPRGDSIKKIRNCKFVDYPINHFFTFRTCETVNVV